METRLLPEEFPEPTVDLPRAAPGAGTAHAIFAGGCFWCTEAVFQELAGVLDVVSGYAGDTAATANYEAVCGGRTNHAEVIRIAYDPSRVTYGALLKVFFAVAHDPTEKDRQGNDVGRQYRSAIFYANDDERRVADAYIAKLGEVRAFPKPIVTTLEPLDEFFEAERYHQDYALRNPMQPYIRAVSTPKVDKLKKTMPSRLRG